MLNFDKTPYFDNHTHNLDPSLDQLTPTQWGRPFYHGVLDNASSDGDFSPHMSHTIQNLGATHAMVGMISKYLGCNPNLEGALAARNALVKDIGTAEYTRRLFKDANIIGSMVDEGVPNTHPLADGFPCNVLSLYRMDKLFAKQFEKCDSYSQMKQEYQSELDAAFDTKGYAAIKCHVGELYNFDVRMVNDAEASAAYTQAKSGDYESKRSVYYAVFSATMLQAQKLDVPIHVHGGITGELWSGGHVSDTDPFKLAPYLLANPEMLETKLVVLHGAFPFIKHAAMLAFIFPNVWVDMSWMTPWVTLSVSNNFRDIIGIAPLSKILLGSGQHGIPEISWMAAKTAKLALAEVLTDIVGQGILGENQAVHIGEMILYKNAERLYKLC